MHSAKLLRHQFYVAIIIILQSTSASNCHNKNLYRIHWNIPNKLNKDNFIKIIVRISDSPLKMKMIIAVLSTLSRLSVIILCACLISNEGRKNWQLFFYKKNGSRCRSDSSILFNSKTLIQSFSCGLAIYLA